MKEIADFIRKNEIAYDWRNNHFYVWPSFYEMDDLKEIIPWDKTEYHMIQNAAVSKDGVCIDLLEVFWDKEVEKYFPREEATP